MGRAVNGIIRNIAPFRQPSPAKNPGGDCFACSLKAVVDALYPERPVPFEVAWEAFKVETAGGGKALSNFWGTMERAARTLADHGYRFSIRRDVAFAEIDLDNWSYAWGLKIDEGLWADRLEAWLAAGWLALAEINFAGTGPVNADGTQNHTDHFVCLDGQRAFWKESSVVKGAASLEHETHVVCSAKGAYWIDTADLLRKHGAGAIMLMRRDVTDRRAAN